MSDDAGAHISTAVEWNPSLLTNEPTYIDGNIETLYDNDGVNEIYWKTNDETTYLRALMHDDGNIRYANYQSENQVSDYLTSRGYESVISDII